MLLVGDIGGTKTDLAVVTPEGGPRAPRAFAELPSASYPSLEALVREFLGRVGLPVTRACFGVPGPVIGGRVQTTNLPWIIEAPALAGALRLESVHLLNDLEAIAHAVPILRGEDLVTLNVGRAVAGGPLAVIAPGTGLGEAFLTWNGSRYVAHASEGGHADFAPTDASQIGLLQYLQASQDHVSVERVCSGLGVPHIYEYLRSIHHAPESPAVAERLAAVSDRTPVIVEAALQPAAPCLLCVATLDIFVDVLGAEAGNLALKLLATGGVYLAGGMPAHILPALRDGRFLRAFRRKGRMGELLAAIPVHVIVTRVGLIGAAHVGLEAMRQTEDGTPSRRRGTIGLARPGPA
jgi:glucokinase